jgi:hypothetical protein
LKIAQRFNAGKNAIQLEKSRQGRKIFADGHPLFCRPLRDSNLSQIHHPAMNGWAIFTKTVDRLVDLIKEHNKWVEPEMVIA